METNKIYQGDCLEVMKQIEDKSVDMILCDLPYGKTNLDWDNKIELTALWIQYKRIIKEKGIIILTGTQPFTSELIISNKPMFKYEIIWEKSRTSNYLRINKEPSRVHENILIFGDYITYNPQTYFVDEKYIDKRKSINNAYNKGQFNGIMIRKKDTGERQPQSVIFFKSHWAKDMHSTQKPVALFEYLIKTYTNEGDLVLDNCIGSGTTAVACINTKRNFIGIELEPKYVEIAKNRIKEALAQSKLCVVEDRGVTNGN